VPAAWQSHRPACCRLAACQPTSTHPSETAFFVCSLRPCVPSDAQQHCAASALLFLDREGALRFETVFVIGTFSGSGSDHRRHHRSPVTALKPTGQVHPKARYRLVTPTVTLRSTSIASGFSAIVLRVAGLPYRGFESIHLRHLRTYLRTSGSTLHLWRQDA
jgi:hypothetical protein